MDTVFGSVAMAAISIPFSFLVARACLKGILRIVTGEGKRRVV